MAKSKKQMVKDELIKNGGEERKIVAENGMSSNYVWVSKEGFEATKEIIISLGGRITELVGEKSTLISVYHGNTSRGMIDFRVEEMKEVEAVQEKSDIKDIEGNNVIVTSEIEGLGVVLHKGFVKEVLGENIIMENVEIKYLKYKEVLTKKECIVELRSVINTEIVKEVETVKEVVVSEATEQEKELSKTKEDILRNLKVFGLNGDSDRVEANIIISSIGIHLKVYVDGKIVYSKKLSDDNRTFGEILLFVERFLTYIDYHELDDKALQEALNDW